MGADLGKEARFGDQQRGEKTEGGHSHEDWEKKRSLKCKLRLL